MAWTLMAVLIAITWLVGEASGGSHTRPRPVKAACGPVAERPAAADDRCDPRPPSAAPAPAAGRATRPETAPHGGGRGDAIGLLAVLGIGVAGGLVRYRDARRAGRAAIPRPGRGRGARGTL